MVILVQRKERGGHGAPIGISNTNKRPTQNSGDVPFSQATCASTTSQYSLVSSRRQVKDWKIVWLIVGYVRNTVCEIADD